MKTFVLDPANKVRAFASSDAAQAPSGAVKFTSEKALAALAADWPMSRLVAIWNHLPGVKPVQKFTDRSTALRRIWTAVENLEPRKRTKAELVIALLSQPAGATLQRIMAETGWQAHSVRGFISGQLSKRLGLRVTSFKHQGERVYRIR